MFEKCCVVAFVCDLLWWKSYWRGYWPHLPSRCVKTLIGNRKRIDLLCYEGVGRIGISRGRVAYHTEHGLELSGISAREWGRSLEDGVCAAWHGRGRADGSWGLEL